MKFSLVLALASASSALAAPVPFSLGDISNLISDVIGDDDNEATPTPVSVKDISDFARIAQFTRAAFCTTPVVQKWACGEACDANPQTRPIIAGGDNGEIPQCKHHPHLRRPLLGPETDIGLLQSSLPLILPLTPSWSRIRGRPEKMLIPSLTLLISSSMTQMILSSPELRKLEPNCTEGSRIRELNFLA